MSTEDFWSIPDVQANAPLIDMLTRALEELTEESKQEVAARLARLQQEGYAPEVAAILAVGILPDSYRQWPYRPRYRMAALENGGMTREAAEQQVRDEIYDWFDRTHQKKGA